MKVQLLTFPECPSAEEARRRLQDVVQAMHLQVNIEEIDVHGADCPPQLRHWGSPTILVEGVDVASGQAQDGTACRLYQQNNAQLGGVPSTVDIQSALEKARSCYASQEASACSTGQNVGERRSVSKPGGNLAVLISSLAAITAGGVAALTSVCCAGPVVVALLGTTGAITAAGLAPYRSYLLLLAFGLLGFAFWRIYFFQRDMDCCPSLTHRGVRWIFWACTIGTVIAATFSLLME